MNERDETVSVRAATGQDAERLSDLAGQLGYPSTPGMIAERLEAIHSLSQHALFVASIESARGSWVAAYIDLHIARHIQSEPCVEIGGLIVDAAARNRGIGVRLLQEAETWAMEHGIRWLRVRSNVLRSDAHRFYEREGYQREKTSAVFTKDVNAAV